MSVKNVLNKFAQVASNPEEQLKSFLAEGKKVVLTAPVYTPDEIVHSMGLVPMGAWGADVELKEAKTYFPAFICSICQSIVELGMKGIYEGASAIIIPSLCDSLKVLGENWKYAVPTIPFIPMTYPQNRKPAYGTAYTKAGYERVIADLEKATGASFEDAKLAKSIELYNEHNKLMREVSDVIANHPEISAKERSSVFKSAFFMTVEEHSELVKALIEELKVENATEVKTNVLVTGILADSPSFLQILDDFDLHIVVDDVAAESRQYKTDAREAATALDSLAEKFSAMDNCSVLYDVEKKRVNMIVESAKKYGAKGVIFTLTKFCDPEEFDYPLIKRACEEAGLPIIMIEVDRQMVDYAQARTMIETFKDVLNA